MSPTEYTMRATFALENVRELTPKPESQASMALAYSGSLRVEGLGPQPPSCLLPSNSPPGSQRVSKLRPQEAEPPIYMSSDASKSPAAEVNMPESRSSEPGRPPGSFRGRAYSSSSRRPTRPQFPTAAASHYDGGPAASSTPPTFQGIPGQYQVPAPYAQRPGFTGSYTMSPPPPPMLHQTPPPFGYPHHAGLHAPDGGMLPPQNQLVSYSPTLVPMPPGYPYSAHGSESSASSTHSTSFASSSPGPSTLFPHPSPPPHSPQGAGPHAPPHTASYAGQTPYAPLRYATPPFYPHSFAPPTPIYPQYPPPHHYTPPMASPVERDAQGTWWYVPGAPRQASSPFEAYPPQYSMPYNLPMGSREVDPYGHPGPPSMQYPPISPSGPYPPPGPSNIPPESPSQQFPHIRSHSTGALPAFRHDPSPTTSKPQGERAAGSSRRAYHPNPPAHRSEWVMWAGNVPQDATYDELWRFFNQSPTPSSASTGSSVDTLYGGVESIFLIARSNCAFVNFQSEPHLQAAITHFNGLPLRPGDPRCPRLVCRVRGRDDDLKAGVGGQRGSGVHVRYVKEQKEKWRSERPSSSSSEHITPSSSPGDPASMLASMSLSSDDEGGAKRLQIGRHVAPHSSSSGSFASTNSSMLTRHFPKRYFILKSLTQFDLDLSVKKGLWATQRHNEGVLDQAFRTSEEVYLIFGVNKSGEFYGYAKMAGPIMHGEHSVSWASRSSDSLSHRRSSRQSSQAGEPPESQAPVYFASPLPFSPDMQSPQPENVMTPKSTDVHGRGFLSAPPELHQPHHKLTVSPHAPQSMDETRPTGPLLASQQRHLDDSFELDSEAPIRAMRDPPAADEDGVKRWDSVPDASLRAVVEEPQQPGASLRAVVEEPQQPEASAAAVAADDGPVWGESFKVQWIRTSRLPFHRTRHLRNPWNHDREVKVSRDGTELEPSAGQALLDEWDRPEEHVSEKHQGTKAARTDVVPGTRDRGDT